MTGTLFDGEAMARITSMEAGGPNVLAFLDVIAWSERSVALCSLRYSIGGDAGSD